MKYWFSIFCSVMVLCIAGKQLLSAQSQTQSKMLMTKHNLSTAGIGTIKASTEKDICVFCHTPHVPRQFAGEQLWNHKLSAADYTLYNSDYLMSLNYAVPNQPNSRSKLCLSCHDGTIAIGEVYNNEGVNSIAMANGVTTMPANASGNIGTSLTNDHPVGFVMDNAKDPELVSRAFPWKTPVRLDPDAANGTLECVSCHEPHDNTFSKFLRIDNTDAALCNFCHTKTGWNDAGHKKSTQAFTPAGGTMTTVGEWACRSCHQSHGGEGTPYLMTKPEEQTCFESGCHGSSGTGVNTKNIQSEYTKFYSHPTISVNAKHKNPDVEASLNLSNRHAECQDCHNSHQAKKTLHAQASNAVSEVLKGVRGVIPEATGSWTQPTTFIEISQSTRENQICFKCHSAFAFGPVVNGVTTTIGPSGTNITDQAMEFNTANKSAHPVQDPLNLRIGSTLPKSLTVEQMKSGWDSVGTQTMYCSDCHGNDQSTSATVPQGPHASNVKFMLTGNAKFWPTNSTGALWTLSDIKSGSSWQSDLFCVNCHTMYENGFFKNSAHDAPDHQNSQFTCVSCHVTVPHGSQRSRLIGYDSDVSPWNYNGSGQFEKLKIIGFEKSATGPNGYTKSSCSTNDANCHGAQIGNYEE